jgi:hypothetical protein
VEFPPPDRAEAHDCHPIGLSDPYGVPLQGYADDAAHQDGSRIRFCYACSKMTDVRHFLRTVCLRENSVRSPVTVLSVLAAILAGCATAGTGAGARASASPEAVAAVAEQILSYYSMPVEPSLGLAGRGRVRTEFFRPHEVWSDDHVRRRVMCRNPHGEWAAPEEETQLRVTVTIRNQGRQPAGPGGVMLPTSAVVVSSGGSFVKQQGQCRISQGFAQEIAFAVAGRFGPSQAAGREH